MESTRSVGERVSAKDENRFKCGKWKSQYCSWHCKYSSCILPNYGGKGMYGSRVHEAVVAAGEKETGITIHWVDAHYDEGDIIFQARCAVDPSDTPTTVADKIHVLEHQHFAPTIEKILLK